MSPSPLSVQTAAPPVGSNTFRLPTVRESGAPSRSLISLTSRPPPSLSLQSEAMASPFSRGRYFIIFSSFSSVSASENLPCDKFIFIFFRKYSEKQKSEPAFQPARLVFVYFVSSVRAFSLALSNSFGTASNIASA